MLVLSRKAGEQVCIGDSVVVTVVAVRNGQVRLAFDAPSGVAIDREELRRHGKRPVPENEEDSVALP